MRFGTLPNVTRMNSVRPLRSLAASLLLAGCTASVPQDPLILTFPGQDKSASDFRQDQAICQRHAILHTGYGLPSEVPVQPLEGAPGGGAATTSPAAAATGDVSAAKAEIPDELSFAQCMAARGDTVVPVSTYDEQSEYAYRGNIGYGSDYPYAYPFFGAGIVGGFGFSHWHHHGYYGGAYHGGGYHGGGYHGGWGGHEGGHGGGHGGGGHGGGGH
jgi:hypothetical protein